VDLNDRHLTEKLAEQEKLEISREKVRQILRGAGSHHEKEAREEASKPPGEKDGGGDDACTVRRCGEVFLPKRKNRWVGL
jgi:hypothetical protein